MLNDYVAVNVDGKLKNLLETIFIDKFMRENTTFDNFEGFRYSSAVITNWGADRMVYSKTLMDGFVNESSNFSSWDEMVRAATDAKFGSK